MARGLSDMVRDEADKIVLERGGVTSTRSVEHLERENAKLRELFNETLIRLAAASEAAGGGFMDARYCELLKNHGIEVDE